MPTLTLEMKRSVIRYKAFFVDDQKIIEFMQEEYGEAVAGLTKQNLEIYDPQSDAFRTRLGQELKDYFFECRKEAENEEATIPIASRFYRLRRLQELLVNEDFAGNWVVQTKLMEQAAKEKGGMYNAASSAKAVAAISGGTSGAGSSDTDRAEELNSLLDTLRARKDGEAAGQGVPGHNPDSGTTAGN